MKELENWEKEFDENYPELLASWGNGDVTQNIKQFIKEKIQLAVKEERERGITEDTSDGYHTFKELYEFRKIYNALIFNEWAGQVKFNVHKSKKHSDGELCFGGGWFIVVASLPSGDISNHYEMKDWDLFQCEERETAKEWDGHTSKDVVDRIINQITKVEE